MNPPFRLHDGCGQAFHFARGLADQEERQALSGFGANAGQTHQFFN